MSSRNNFEKKTKTLLDGYMVEPPSSVWDNIENKLDAGNTPGWKKYLRYSAVVTLMLAFSWLVYEISVQQDGDLTDTGIIQHDFTDYYHSMIPEPLESITLPGLISTPPGIARDHLHDRTNKLPGDYDDPGIIISESEAISQGNEGLVLYDADVEYQVQLSHNYIKDNYVLQLDEQLIDKGVAYFANLDTYPGLASKRYHERINLADNVAAGKKWAIGLYAAPNYTYRINSSEPYELDRGRNIFERNESDLITYNFGININYRLSNRVYIESGLYYSKMGQSIRNISVKNSPQKMSLYGGDPEDKNPLSLLTSMGEISFYDETLYFEDVSEFVINNRSNRVKNASTVKEGLYLQEQADRVNQYLGFIEIPIKIRLNIVESNQFIIQLKGGFSSNYLISNDVVLKKGLETNNIGETSLVRSWNFSISGGAALMVPITNQLYFHLEPTANLFVNSMTEGREYNVYPYSLSLYTGFSIPF